MQHIYLLRHGTTEAMEAEIAQGITDSPLSPLGKKQAQAAAEALKPVKFDVVYCSPLGRAYETADLICSSIKMEPQVMQGLREMDFGWLEGSAYFDTPKSDTPVWQYPLIIARIFLAQLTGDSLKSLKKRADQNWQEIRSRCPQGTILVVSHSIILNYMLRVILPISGKIEYYHLKPCSISDLFIHDDGRIEIGCLNRIEHLKNLE